jgi:PKD repeat protein
MKTKKLLCLIGFLAFFVLISCTKDEEKPKPTAAFTASKTAVIVGEEIQFTNTSENATSYSWSFGDGTTSTEASPAKSYNATGTFTVTLVATGEGGSNSTTLDITVTAASLYFMDSSDELMEKLVLDGTGTVTTVKDLAGMSGVGIAYDSVQNKIYFSDFYDADTPDGKIWRMNFDGTGLEAIASGILDPYGIALDVTGGKVYWVDDAGNVSRANLDGSSPEIGLIYLPDGWLRAIALDPENNKMYFYDVNMENLYVANLNGSDTTVLIPGVYGYAICVDTRNDKIYFDDQNTPGLRRANLDGTGIVTIDGADTRIYGIDIDYDMNKLYWSARDAGEIYRANLDGTNKEILKTGLTSPRGIFLKK